MQFWSQKADAQSYLCLGNDSENSNTKEAVRKLESPLDLSKEKAEFNIMQKTHCPALKHRGRKHERELMEEAQVHADPWSCAGGRPPHPSPGHFPKAAARPWLHSCSVPHDKGSF